MTRAFSAIPARVARIAAAVLTLMAITVLTNGATAAPSSANPTSGLSVSLVQSSTAVPISGSLGFTGHVRFPADTSSVQARLQVRRNGGRLVYQRTQYLNTPTRNVYDFAFSRPLEGLGLAPGTYPATFSLHADVDGSLVSTEVATVLRIYDPADQPVSAVVLVKVHARPLDGPDGQLVTDPASPEAVRARDQVDRVATIVTTDPNAKLSLALPPLVIEEWKRIATNGYTLASGTVVPPTSATPAEYAATLLHVQQALATGRLELLTMGYADPSLADLNLNKLNADAGIQYDAGLSAMFTSLEATPSQGTAPAGGSVPKPMQRPLLARQVRFAFVDADSTRIGKRTGVATGVYRSADSSLTALVVDARAGRGLESGDASATLSRTFERLGTSSAAQPVIVRIDLDEGVSDASSTVGVAFSALETAPWIRLKAGSEVRPPKGAHSVTFVPVATKNAPADFWPRVKSSRAHAIGMLAALTASDDQATASQVDSLIAESSEWSDPSAKWAYAKYGMAFADAALKRANDLFKNVKVSATSVTLAGATGGLPVNIQNGSNKTMAVSVVTRTSTGIAVVGSPVIPTRLAPGETYVQVPIDMQGAVYGKVTVEVLAGNVIVARRTVTVRRSYLDRLALIGGIVLVLGGLLGWIVVRVRRSPDVDEEYDEYGDDEEYDDEPADGTNVASQDEDARPRYTEPRSEAPTDTDKA